MPEARTKASFPLVPEGIKSALPDLGISSSSAIDGALPPIAEIVGGNDATEGDYPYYGKRFLNPTPTTSLLLLLDFVFLTSLPVSVCFQLKWAVTAAVL